MKTYMVNPQTVERKWIHIDAEGMTLGRLACTVADLLRGKNKVDYTPHVDCGDFVIITNAEKFHVTGNKMDDKIYFSHSGFPGGAKRRTMKQIMNSHPDRIIQKAVKGMIPHNRLGRQIIKKLKVYAGPNHPHSAQKPVSIDVTSKGEYLNV